MKHIAIHDLALFASHDLPWWRGIFTARHVGGCEQCRREVQSFAEAKLQLETETEVELGNAEWNRLAGEMTANIRLGLEAGECVGHSHAAPPKRDAWRAAVALATIFLLMAGAWFLRRPDSDPFHFTFLGAGPIGARQYHAPSGADEVLLKATLGGIGVERNGRSLVLPHEAGATATVTVGMQGSMNARYIDDDTGQVTIHNVYAQ